MGDDAIPRDSGPAQTCYVCGAPTTGVQCSECGSLLALTRPRQIAGLAYLLNRLPGLVEAGTLDADSAGRLAGAIGAELASLRAPREAPALDAARAARDTARRDALLAEQAPSLLLYVGAFLIVVSALIFVNVSGRQISDTLKLALMVAGTGGFLGAGVACHRIPRVLPAGRTFLAVGGLLVPIDVAAIYVLFLRVDPLTHAELWFAGSLVASLLYAVLSLAGFGAWYARFTAVAAVSALLAASSWAHLDEFATTAWLVLLALALLLATKRGVSNRYGRRLTDELRRPAEILAAVALTPAVLVVLNGIVSNHRVTVDQRLATFVALVLGTVFFALEFEGRRARAAALALGGLAVLAIPFIFFARTEHYGLALLLLAYGYGIASTRPDLLARVPHGLAARGPLGMLAMLWLGGGLLLFYEPSPIVGALVYLGAVPLLVAVELRRRSPALVRLTRDVSADLSRPALFLAAAVLHAGVRWLLIALPIEPLQALVRGTSASAVAIALFPTSLLLFALAAASWWRRHPLRDALALAALASAVAVATIAPADSYLRAIVTAADASFLAVAAVTLGAPRLMWVAGAFAAQSAVAFLLAFGVSAVGRSEWLMLAAVVLYLSGAALARSAPAYARRVREVALAALLLAAALVLFDPRPPRGSPLVPSDAWLVAADALAVLAFLGVAESAVRRTFAWWLGASMAALVAGLMFIAQAGASDTQAYSIPVGAYLVAVALFARRFDPPRAARVAVAGEIAGSLILFAVPWLASWGPDGFGSGVGLLVMILVVLAIGILLRRRQLVTAALSFLGLLALRELVDAANRVPAWASFALSGAALLAVGFVLLVKRPAWERTQRKALAWWERLSAPGE